MCMRHANKVSHARHGRQSHGTAVHRRAGVGAKRRTRRRLLRCGNHGDGRPCRGKKTYRTVGKKNLSGSVHAMLPYPGLTTRRHANTHIEKGKRVKQERTHKRKHNHTCKETHNSARHEKNDAAKQTATLTVSVTSSKAHFHALFRARAGARGPSGGQGRAAASHTGAEALRAGGGRRRRTEVERVILAVLFLILLARGLSVVQLLVRGLEVRVPVAGTVHHSTCRGRQRRGRGGHGGRSRCRSGRVAVARGARRWRDRRRGRRRGRGAVGSSGCSLEGGVYDLKQRRRSPLLLTGRPLGPYRSTRPRGTPCRRPRRRRAARRVVVILTTALSRAGAVLAAAPVTSTVEAATLQAVGHTAVNAGPDDAFDQRVTHELLVV